MNDLEKQDRKARVKQVTLTRLIGGARFWDVHVTVETVNITQLARLSRHNHIEIERQKLFRYVSPKNLSRRETKGKKNTGRMWVNYDLGFQQFIPESNV